jgi:hypothetical protein
MPPAFAFATTFDIPIPEANQQGQDGELEIRKD